MCDPTEPFEFPELTDEAVIAIDAFLEEFYTRQAGCAGISSR